MYFKNYQKKIHFLHHENRVQKTTMNVIFGLKKRPDFWTKITLFSNVTGHSASTERPAPRRPSRSKAAPKDIESLISNNLMKLRSLSPSSKAAKATDEGSNLIYDRLEMFLGHFESNIGRGKDTLLLTYHYY